MAAWQREGGWAGAWPRGGREHGSDLAAGGNVAAPWQREGGTMALRGWERDSDMATAGQHGSDMAAMRNMAAAWQRAGGDMASTWHR